MERRVDTLTSDAANLHAAYQTYIHAHTCGRSLLPDRIRAACSTPSPRHGARQDGSCPLRGSYDVPLLLSALLLQGARQAVRASRSARSVRVSAVAAPQQVRDTRGRARTI